jgi:hypothetical protein
MIEPGERAPDFARVFPGVKPDEHDDLVLGALAELTATA